MRPKHPWVRGRWTIRETEQSGSACRVSSVAIGAFWLADLLPQNSRCQSGARSAPSLASIRPHLVAKSR